MHRVSRWNVSQVKSSSLMPDVHPSRKPIPKLNNNPDNFFCILQEKIRSNYDAIRFRPEHFIDYLLSDSVGFATFEVLEIPQHKAAGK